MPQFSQTFKHLILKKYFNIGIAVETEEGLVVPVLREADKKGVIQTGSRQRRSCISSQGQKAPL